ncbi:phosphoribosyltransferase-like protein [Hymenobacter terricola]|uniref:phosphoribosyltransferase-like protein n=1 Tax=Hymenobacter terricola TaxID=2819236 RepID=UPI001B318584|nr:hypothetical protein [Hymenobacter terricola]
MWPPTNAIDSRQWLKNFVSKEEKAVAHDLLRGFLVFSERMTRELFRSAIQKIMPHVVDFSLPAAEVQAAWRQAVERMLIVPVRGETPNLTDSGFGYARLFRDVFGLRQSQFLPITQVVSRTMGAVAPAPIVVFVDDFVGSGEQFIKLWQAQQEQAQHGWAFSFEEAAPSGAAQFFYCPLAASSYGLAAIEQVCGSHVTLCPAHVVSAEYNALSPSYRFWSSTDVQQSGPAVLANIARRVGMPAHDNHHVDDWRGYHRLGLGLVLGDAMPDACLGVFRFNQRGWHPLFNKAG